MSNFFLGFRVFGTLFVWKKGLKSIFKSVFIIIPVNFIISKEKILYFYNFFWT